MGEYLKKTLTEVVGKSEVESIMINKSLDTISRHLILGDITVFDSLRQMSELVNSTIRKIVTQISVELEIQEYKLPFAVFLFGSPSRNVMLPNSDLDIGIVFQEGVDEKFKDSVRSKFTDLPFDKVDFASWSSLFEMEKVNSSDLIENNKSIDAKYIAGNITIRDTHEINILGLETQQDKSRRIITEYSLFHCFDYLSKITTTGPNLKYDFGASRDIIFLDWYYLLKFSGPKSQDQPFFIHGLEYLVSDSIIDSEEEAQLKIGIELIMLVKFSLLFQSRKTGNKELLYLNDSSLETCFEISLKALEKLGISNLEELKNRYYKAKTLLKIAVIKIFESTLKGDTEMENVIKLSKTEVQLTYEIMSIIKCMTWHHVVPFVIHSKSPEILKYIIELIKNKEDFTYILRIVSENLYIDQEIVEILLTTSLPQKYKDKLISKKL